MQRGEIYWANVPKEHTLGSEQHNEDNRPRPWLILSDGRLFSRGNMVIAVPITSKLKAENLAPFRRMLVPDEIFQTPEDKGVLEPGTILCDQIRAIAAERLAGRLGKLKPAVLAEVELKVANVLGMTSPSKATAF